MNKFIKKVLVALLRSTASRYYEGAKLSKKDVPKTPLPLFKEWFDLAVEIDKEWGNSVTLSTASLQAKPSNRLVLLKSYDDRGFVFYTNYNSRKARELTENPQASLVFWWKELFRQVRIEGIVVKTTPGESNDYFMSRGRGSRIGAWASNQSSILKSRAELESKILELSYKYKGKEIPRPDFWGGYRLVPLVIEFWQARNDRLHDRIRYQRENGKQAINQSSWVIDRLSP